MMAGGHGPPLFERQGVLRGIVELLGGAYPRFVFGGEVGDCLPVFHFHETTPEHLRPRLEYLAENGYRTVTSEEICRLVRNGAHPGRRTVALCFDDARASLWTVVGPLLREYDQRAITFVVPGRVRDAPSTRPTLRHGIADPAAADVSDQPFATWPELRALHASGHVDIQSHTYSHAMVFCDDRVVGYVTPEYERLHVLDRPLLEHGPPLRFLEPEQLGAPLYPRRSRMSDARRYHDDASVRARCTELVARADGPAFFDRSGWERELDAITASRQGRLETEAERDAAIAAELTRSRGRLAQEIPSLEVRMVCLPWAIAGEATRRILPRTGYRAAFSDHRRGTRAVRAGDDPYRLMRLHERFLFNLPGTGRKIFPQFVRRGEG